MNKFNLEKALAGEKVVTAKGDEVTQLKLLSMSTGSKLVGVHEDTLCVWNSDGRFDHERLTPRDLHLDLKMAPVMGSGFLYVNVDGGTVLTGEKSERFSNHIMCFDLSKYPIGFGIRRSEK